MRAPRSILAYLAASIAAIVLFFVLAGPAFREWRSGNRTVQTLLGDAANIPYYSNQAALLEFELSVLTQKTDQPRTALGLLTDIPGLAGRSGIRTIRLENIGSDKTDPSAATVRIRFKSPFPASAEFLAALERTPYSGRIEMLEMSAEPDGLSVIATATFTGLTPGGQKP